MTNSKKKDKKYDLLERTAKFGGNIILFAKKIPKNSITLPLISQLVKAGTSVGGNYCEADNAESKKDFIHKLGICKKEARETKHWLRMIVIACSNIGGEVQDLSQEATGLNLIFNAIINKTKDNCKN